MFYLLSFLGFFWPLQRDCSVFCHLGVLPLKFLWNSQNYQECAKKKKINKGRNTNVLLSQFSH